jgi:hypothetical protein
VPTDERPYGAVPSLKGRTKYRRQNVWTDAGRDPGTSTYLLLRNVTQSAAIAVFRALTEAGWYVEVRDVADDDGQTSSVAAPSELRRELIARGEPPTREQDGMTWYPSS